jgi:hypothetical protein
MLAILVIVNLLSDQLHASCRLNHAKYEAEMRQALERWAEHVQPITFS